MLYFWVLCKPVDCLYWSRQPVKFLPLVSQLSASAALSICNAFTAGFSNYGGYWGIPQCIHYAAYSLQTGCTRCRKFTGFPKAASVQVDLSNSFTLKTSKLINFSASAISDDIVPSLRGALY